MTYQVKSFLFVFLENLGHHKLFSKLTFSSTPKKNIAQSLFKLNIGFLRNEIFLKQELIFGQIVYNSLYFIIQCSLEYNEQMSGY